eukprot:scaffold87761_cov32-Tisochrysis_lutea.AAC.3
MATNFKIKGRIVVTCDERMRRIRHRLNSRNRMISSGSGTGGTCETRSQRLTSRARIAHINRGSRTAMWRRCDNEASQCLERSGRGGRLKRQG